MIESGSRSLSPFYATPAAHHLGKQQLGSQTSCRASELDPPMVLADVYQTTLTPRTYSSDLKQKTVDLEDSLCSLSFGCFHSCKRHQSLLSSRRYDYAQLLGCVCKIGPATAVTADSCTNIEVGGSVKGWLVHGQRVSPSQRRRVKETIFFPTSNPVHAH